MINSTYQNWLEQQGYVSGTVQAQMHRAGRVEECYGDIDEHYNRDQLRSVIDELKYSADDERRNKPNPSKIPFNGNTRKILPLTNMRLNSTANSEGRRQATRILLASLVCLSRM